MTKFLDYLDRNAIKIALISILILGVFIGCLYVSTIKSDVARLSTKIVALFLEQSENQKETTDLTFQGLLLIIEQLEDVAKTQQYIIDQNRDRVEKETGKKSTTKPTYEEIRSHSVWIEGCSGGADHDDELSFPIGDNGACWGGTGVVIKTGYNETYILTNNHVSGKGEQDVKIYVENDKTHKLVKAVIVAQHKTVDAAVIKIYATLPGKKAISGIATANVQDPVYVVGNPLGVRDVYSEGVVAGYEDTSMLLQMPCIYGNSGSGVFDQNGKLVGLVYALETYPGWMGIPEARITHSLVVDSISIRTFLKDLGLYE
jgi:S1-C subfamily serine protease